MKSKHDITALILAGGKGSRLRSVVSDRQKVVAKINGNSFLLLLLEQLERSGVNKAILCSGHLSETVHSAMQEYHGSVKVEFSEEQEPLGTGGAVRNALSKITSPNCLIMNGDSFIKMILNDFIDWFILNGYIAGIVITSVDDTSRYGRVDINESGRVLGFAEKSSSFSGPGKINGGIYLIKTDLLHGIPAEPKMISLEKQFFQKLVSEGLLYGWESSGMFIDIGTPESYEKAQTLLNGGIFKDA